MRERNEKKNAPKLKTQGRENLSGVSQMVASAQTTEQWPCDLLFCEMFLGQPEGNSWGNRKPSGLSGALCLRVLSIVEGRTKVCGCWGMREDVAGRSKSRATSLWVDLWSHSNMGQGLYQGKGLCLPVDDFLPGMRTLPLQQWLSIHPLSPSAGVTSTGPKLIYRQLDHVLFPFLLSNRRKSFKDCGWRKVFSKCLLKNKETNKHMTDRWNPKNA